jgi:zinc transporter, ZIP family
MVPASAQLSPVLLALMAGLFTWGMTALGAGFILVGRSPSRRTLDTLLGFSAGVMLAASYWSLLAPSVEMAAGSGTPTWIPPVVGFGVGGLGLWALDNVLPHLHAAGRGREFTEGIVTRWPRSTLLILAITLHNIPEGLALGVAIGAAAGVGGSAAFGAAIALAIGLGLQNLPEGLAVSAPLRREGWSRTRSFFFGQLSGVVEPIAAVVGVALVGLSTGVLPYALAFAAGAMIYVVIEEFVPECHRSGHSDVAVLAALLGFMVMTGLDVALG